MIEYIVYEILKEGFSMGFDLEQCRQKLIKDLRRRGFQPLADSKIIEIFNSVAQYSHHVVLQRRKTTARPYFTRTRVWRDFDAEDLQVKMPHWNRYKKSLEENGWSDEDIHSVQQSSTDIYDAISDAETRKWASDHAQPIKGLVLGYVQSGKTASMAGVMAIAADYDYDMVIVLSGIHNKLNDQTTRRFENDLWTYVKHGHNYIPKRDAYNHVMHLKNHRQSWYNITSETDNLRAGQMQFLDIAKPIFGVFKKNATILNNLNNWIENNGHFFGNNFKLLIIDDECDQASPNVRDYKTGEESTINKRLTDIIYNNHFPYVTYIGYTATPFASILNEPPGERSLYPEDFIHTLAKPVRHFGVKEVFGQSQDSDIPMAVIMKQLKESDDDEELVKELKSAIAYFICVCASRYFIRGHSKHTTMLVHTSSRVNEHQEWKNIISTIVNNFKDNNDDMIDECRIIWEKQRLRLSPDVLSRIFNMNESEFVATEPFSSIQPELVRVLNGTDKIDALKISMDNSSANTNERLFYPDLSVESNKPCPIIAVGGNTLSRGLTLEGLTVSFFLRDVVQMDSLLQMGRWFGYRRGYEDLVRVWTTKTTLDYFQHIGLVEMDLREQILGLYKDSGVSPDEVALTVKTHPQMRVVRASAMQAASDRAVYFGTAPQTYYFKHKDQAWLKNNWDAANSLLKDLDFSDHMFATATPRDLFDFFDRVNVHELHTESMGPEYLKEFLKNANDNGHLLHWNVAVASKPKIQDVNLNQLEGYKYIVRSKIEYAPPEFPGDANIKTLRAPGDLFLDLNISSMDSEEKRLSATNSPAARSRLFDYRKIDHEDRPGLLLLYPIKKHAEKHEIRGTGRLDLDAVSDILGWSIVLPTAGSVNMSELYERVGIQIK